MDAREGRETDVAGGLGLLDRQRQGAGAGRVVAGLALRTAEARELVRLGLPEPEPSRRFGRATEVQDGVVEATLDPCELTEDRVPADVEPRVVDPTQPMLDLVARLDSTDVVAGRDGGSGGEEPVRGLIPRPVEPAVEGVRAIGQLHRLVPLALMRDHVGEVVGAARLQVDVVDRLRQSGGLAEVFAGMLEPVGRGLDPRGEQQRAGAVACRRIPAGGLECREDPLRAAAVTENDPGPTEPVDDAQCEQGVMGRAPRQGGVDVGPLDAREGEVFCLPAAPHTVG
jgi:hypothetical protein